MSITRLPGRQVPTRAVMLDDVADELVNIEARLLAWVHELRLMKESKELCRTFDKAYMRVRRARVDLETLVRSIGEP